MRSYGPAGLVVIAMISVQSGAAVSTWMFDEIGPMGTAFTRLAWAAVFLLLWARPRLRGRGPGDLRVAATLGAMSAAMTIFYFLAVERIPLGVASALEFLGPLGVAIFGLRGRRLDLLWPTLAAVGVLALARPWEGSADLVGLLFGALSGACLGGYVVFTQKVGDRFAGVDGLALSLTVAALCAAPFGLPQAVGHFSTTVVVGSAAAALLLPVLPYVLEMVALRRLTTAAMGTLMSFEPGIAAVVGLVLLSQSMTLLQCFGLVCVVLASIGAVQRGRRPDATPEPLDASAGVEAARR
ncbi:EamA family transporter [Streptomyces sp. NPDC005899]|uniref:EamA family transporter n=1 Tax=Streptomyces sp. NPDC005899 TaxID=3155716 RepID=UPI0033F83F4A